MKEKTREWYKRSAGKYKGKRGRDKVSGKRAHKREDMRELQDREGGKERQQSTKKSWFTSQFTKKIVMCVLGKYSANTCRRKRGLLSVFNKALGKSWYCSQHIFGRKTNRHVHEVC